jgi:chromosome segregation ATPase
MQIYSMAIAGSALFIIVALVAVTTISQLRLRRVQRELNRRRIDDELDRRRIHTTIERSQLEVSNANNRLQETRTECERLRADLSQQEALAKETLKKFTDAHERVSTLQEELRSQRAQLDQLTSLKAELFAEKKHLDETKKALTAARVNSEKVLRETAETKKLLAAERHRLSEKEKQENLAQAELAKLGEEVTQLSGKLSAASERLRLFDRLEAKTTELTARNTELERELSSVIQVASTVNAVELDREELQVRLETAAYSVKLARKEADRFRASTEALQTEVSQLRSDLSKFESRGHDSERLANENTKLIAAQSRHTQLLHSMQTRLDEAAKAIESAEARADEALSEQQRLTRALEDSEVERRAQQAQIDSLSGTTQQLDQLRAEIATLSRAESAKQAAEAEVSRLTSELRANQASLRNAQVNFSELEKLRENVFLLQEEQRSHLEAEQRLLALQSELRTLKGNVSSAHEKRMDAEQIEKLRNENQMLREDIAQLREHEKASIALEQLTGEYKRSRLESELLTRRVQELSLAQEELTDLRRQALEHHQRKEEVTRLTNALGLLEAQLFALGHVPTTKQNQSSIKPTAVGTKAHEIETQLSPMLERTKLRSVVLADASGFQVVAAGESLTQEGLAAYSALAAQLAQRARRLLPVGDVLLVNLVDSNRMVVSCRLFALGQEEFAVATIGPEQLELPEADEVVEALRNSMTIALAGPDKNQAAGESALP